MDRSNRRKRKRINYYNSEEPALDEYVYCENCYDFVYEYCSLHGPLLIIPDNKIMSRAGIPDWVPRAALTTPRAYVHIAPSIISGAGLGVFSSVTLPRGVRFGPFRGRNTDEVTSMYCWQVRKKAKLAFVDGSNGETSNWMRFVNCARNWQEQNLVAFQYQEQIYYRTIKIIPKFTELLVYYGSEFAYALGIDLKNYNKSKRVHIAKYGIDDVNADATIADRQAYQKGIYNTETLEVSEVIPRNNNFDEIVDTKEMANVVMIDVEEDLKNITNNLTTEINNKSNFTLEKDIQPKIFNEFLKYEETTNTPADGEDFQQNIRLTNNIDNQMSLNVDKDTQPKVCDEETTTPSDGEHFQQNTLRLTNHNYNQMSLNVQKYTQPKACDEETTTPSDGEHFQQNTLRLTNNIYNQMSLNVHKDTQPKVCDEETTTPSDGEHFQQNTLRLTNIINNQISLNVRKDIPPKVCNEETTTPSDGEHFQQNTLRLTNHNYNQMSLNVHKYTQPKVCDEETSTPTDGEHFQQNTQRLPNHIDNQMSSKIQKDIQPKVCDICNKGYKTNWSLREHKMVHEEPRYYCSQCSYKTSNRSYFNRHMDRHTKHKIFQCELCPYVGHVRDDLRRHVNRIHTNKR